MVSAATTTGQVGMMPDIAEALAAFRKFNYEHIYLRPASQRQSDAVISLLRALVEHYADRPHALPEQTTRAVLGDHIDLHHIDAGSSEALRASVGYVAGMTDRFACQQGVNQLHWDPAKLPTGIGVN